MAWEVEFTDEFEAWWGELDEEEQVAIDAHVRLLEAKGPTLSEPHSKAIVTSRHDGMRELRVSYRVEPYRVLYMFDPRRAAILLLGGNKAGDKRWYEEHVPLADALYDRHLETLKKETVTRGKKV